MQSYKRFSLITIILSLLLAGIALAAGPFELLQNVWQFLIDFARLKFIFGASGADTEFVGFLRLLIGILVGMIVYGTLRTLTGGAFSKVISFALSVIIAILSTVLIPASILIAIAGTGSVVVGVIFLILYNLPLIGILFLISRFKKRFLSFVAFVLLLFYMALTSFLGNWGADLTLFTTKFSLWNIEASILNIFSYLGLIYFLMAVFFLLNWFRQKSRANVGSDNPGFFAKLFGFGKDKYGKGKEKLAKLSAKGKFHYNNLKKFMKEADWLGKARREAINEKTAVLNEYLDEKKEIKAILNARVSIGKFYGAHEQILQRTRTMASISGIQEMVLEWSKFRKDLNDMIKRLGKLERATSKQNRHVHNLVEDLKNAGVAQSDFDEVIETRTQIFALHKRIHDNMKKMRTYTRESIIGGHIARFKKDGHDSLPSPHYFIDGIRVYEMILDMEEPKKEIAELFLAIERDQKMSYKMTEELIGQFKELFEIERKEEAEIEAKEKATEVEVEAEEELGRT